MERLAFAPACELSLKRKKPPFSGRFRIFMVAPKGFEPSTSALRGRRPKPLDDGATFGAVVIVMAGVEGVEPSHTAPETAVLPLDDTPTSLAGASLTRLK